MIEFVVLLSRTNVLCAAANWFKMGNDTKEHLGGRKERRTCKQETTETKKNTVNRDGLTSQPYTKQTIHSIPLIFIWGVASSPSWDKKTETGAGRHVWWKRDGKTWLTTTRSHSLFHYSWISLQNAAVDVTGALKCISITQSWHGVSGVEHVCEWVAANASVCAQGCVCVCVNTRCESCGGSHCDSNENQAIAC